MADAMIPTRTRLATWHPQRLSDAAPGVTAAGDHVESVSAGSRSYCAGLPADRGWSGTAHDAAQGAFDRGFKNAVHISDICSAVSSALTTAFHAVSRAQRDLLDAVARVEGSGTLTVDDHWVVELAAIAWTAEAIEDARQAQRDAQTEINERLTAMAAADDPQTLLAAVKAMGIEVRGTQGGLPLPGSIPPGDEAPNPAGVGEITAMLQQDNIRRQWEASTPRKVTEEHVPEHDGYQGYRKKTLEMQDGSRQEITTTDPLSMPWMENTNTSRREEVSVTTFDPSGTYVSQVSSWNSAGGTKYTQTDFANGTSIVYTQSPDGKKTASIDVGGYSREIPADDKLWKHPVSDVVGSALTGVETGVGKADDIPRVSAATASKVEVGARYAGPAVGIATSLVDVYRASTLEDKCVAAASGTGGLVGGQVGGQVGAWGLGLLTENPAGVGAGAAGGSLSGGWIGSFIGEKVGDVLCR